MSNVFFRIIAPDLDQVEAKTMRGPDARDWLEWREVKRFARGPPGRPRPTESG